MNDADIYGDAGVMPECIIQPPGAAATASSNKPPVPKKPAPTACVRPLVKAVCPTVNVQAAPQRRTINRMNSGDSSGKALR